MVWLALDLLVKLVVLLTVGLKTSQIMGTVWTMLLSYYLWNGSNVARWLYVTFLVLSIFFCVYVITTSPKLVWIVVPFAFISVVSIVLLCSSKASAFVSNEGQADGKH